MRVVIAGSSGLIGTALVPRLREAGHEVVRLVRRTPHGPDERGWDPSAGHIEPGALDGADAVVNLNGVGVGDKRWTGAFKQELRDSRLIPTDLLARAVAEKGIPVMVSASGVDYYADAGDMAIDENARSGTGFLSALCRDWERATAPASDAGARVVLLRSGLVLSPSGGVMGRIKPLFRFGLGARLGSGKQYWPWITLDDEVAVITHALESETLTGPINATGPAPVTNAEFTRCLAEHMGRPAPWFAPPIALRVALGEFADEALLTSKRALPVKLEQDGYAFRHKTLGEALHAVLDG
ncbi:TIGR01777 family oxidoreductase [Actinomycetospora cinnamomea]|uniref:TIGR01777 family protein n=1 Tax=Actinomycetospora cinnamomea TaxID=663609 RepID=A0A2U1FAJ2_9PSEU|nr:TIGR01777 family oxidoreductase [Actinomycetospora cinnamomea]PVZ08990.1 hypothetical protein C8D89_107152 [Actinomycetospora cinnamomea]